MASDKPPAACVIGWPIEHSRSPLIHNYWLRRYGIAGAYRREAVAPDQIAAFIASLSACGYVGANVTVPHKEVALALSQPDDRARSAGAANTLWFESGVLRSTNTDVEGFLDNLDAAAAGWDRDREKAVVLGAGGAARGVVYALLLRGFARIVVLNRTLERAEALRARFGERVQPARWEERDALVAELVYVPLETALIRSARARGLRSADGLGMLLYQAVRGFALWFGKKPEVTAELRRLLEMDLAGSGGAKSGIS
jgi:shikimate dehydrogenase